MDYDVPATPELGTTEAKPAPADATEATTESVQTIAARLDRGEPFVHNFDGDKREQYKKVAIACGSAPMKSTESTGRVVDLQYYFAHRVLMTDPKTGEEFDQLRIVIFDKNGDTYSFASAGIADSLNLIIGVFGNGPWSEPMEHKITSSRTNSGRNMLSLVPV